MNKIVGLGETVLDLIFRQDKPQTALPGGSTFNAMISLGRTAGRDFPDLKIVMVTDIGDDHVGDMVMDFMAANNVCTDSVIRHDSCKTKVAMAFLNERNDASYQFYSDPSKPSLNAAHARSLTFSEGDIVIFGSYFAINPADREFTYSVLKSAREAGAVIYYDINFRKNHISELDTVKPIIEENCGLSDFVRASDEDMSFLIGSSDPDVAYRSYMSKLCSNFICTRGALPVKVYSPEFCGSFDVPQVKTVSTIGAGDNFNAGFIYGLYRSAKGKSPLRGFDAVGWGRQVALACSFSSAVCESINNYVDAGFEVQV